MHVIPSSLQVGTLPSAVEAGLSKCTTLQKLTVWRSPPSVTAALLKTVTVNKSLEELTLKVCHFGMCTYSVCMRVCVRACVHASLCVFVSVLVCVCMLIYMSLNMVTAYNVCGSALPPVSPSKTTCLLRSPAGGVDKEVVDFLSHLKEFKQLRKVKMTAWEILSPSLIATICGGLCISNSLEEMVVASSEVSDIRIWSECLVCLSLLSCPSKPSRHLFRRCP